MMKNAFLSKSWIDENTTALIEAGVMKNAFLTRSWIDTNTIA